MGLPQIVSGLPEAVAYVQTGVFGPKAAGVATGLGTILAAVGVKHAIAKNK